MLYYLSEVCGDQDNVQRMLEELIKALPDQELTIMTYGQQLRQQGWQEGKQEGWQQGKQEGKQEGWQQGKQEGKQEGWQQCAKETAKNLFINGVSEAIVQKATGLPEEIVRQLKKEIQH